jgi:transcriptional regulator with XRE-family HTH domain
MADIQGKNLGERLNYLLRKNKISNRAFGMKVGKSGQAIADIIAGSMPRKDLLNAIAKELDVTPEELLVGYENEEVYKLKKLLEEKDKQIMELQAEVIKLLKQQKPPKK